MQSILLAHGYFQLSLHLTKIQRCVSLHAMVSKSFELWMHTERMEIMEEG